MTLASSNDPHHDLASQGARPDVEVVVVVGPTASGKSSLADKIAQRLGAPVISADAMQVYRGMDVGTAKTPVRERPVPLLGIDLVDIGQPFSAALFQSYARPVIDDLLSSGTTPVICGGTGLYVNAVIDCMEFPRGDQLQNPVREKYEALLASLGEQGLHDLLASQDPTSAALIHPRNSRRVIRAFELLAEGVSYAKQHEGLYAHKPFYRPFIIGLTMDRALLYERINKRVDVMVERGLLSEVRSLVDQGLGEALTAQQAIGYKELIEAFDGLCTVDEALERIKQSSRRYAKRQLTWFNKDPRIHWIDRTDLDDAALFERAQDLLRTQAHICL